MALPFSYNLRNLRVRWKVTLLAVVGIALVVAVFVVVAAMANGFRLALRDTGSVDNGIVTQRGSMSELTSGLPRSHVSQILVDSRVARDANGQPMASPEQMVLIGLPRRTDGQLANVAVRGVGPMAFVVRRGIRIVEGRNFRPGLYEVMVGRKIQQRVSGLEMGQAFKMQRHDWVVVGAFESDGNGFESEVWGDIETMRAAVHRGGYSSLTVRLADPAALKAFDAELRRNPQMQVQLTAEREYYENQSGLVSGALLALAAFVSLVMGIGAVFGAMNTMYAIVAARTREIGTLRAVGFSRRSVLFSFVAESVMLALAGGVLGCVLALPANGAVTATGNTQNFSELVAAFRITPPTLIAGLVFAVVMGLVGGFLPAFRAARLPIASALREA